MVHQNVFVDLIQIGFIISPRTFKGEQLQKRLQNETEY